MQKPVTYKNYKNKVKRYRRGFTHAGGLLSQRFQQMSERRGFSQLKLLTHWSDIVGADIARITEPVKISYSAKGMGGTLILLCKGAHGPEVEMQLPLIKERVNGVYGYNAVSRIKVTQTASVGFKSDQNSSVEKPDKKLGALDMQKATLMVDGVQDKEFRAALEALALNVSLNNQSE